MLAVGVMLDDINLFNGPLMVIPGTHKGPVLNHNNSDGIFCGAIDPKDKDFNLNNFKFVENKNLKFYEFGSVYSLDGNKYIEEKRLTILLCGNLIDNAWNSKNIKSEIFILKNKINYQT